jgi:hypothetical protein
VLFPEAIPNNLPFQLSDRVQQGNLLDLVRILKDDETQTFVWAGQWTVVGWRGGSEPALVDAAAFAAEA